MLFLDREAGPKFVQKIVFHISLTILNKHGRELNIRDANKDSLKLLQKSNLSAMLASYNDPVKFFLSSSITATLILGAYFCHNFVQATRPGNKVAELEDGKPIPVLCNGLHPQQRSQQRSMRTPHGHKKNDKMPSSLIRASTTIDTLLQGHAWVPLHLNSWFDSHKTGA